MPNAKKSAMINKLTIGGVFLIAFAVAAAVLGIALGDVSVVLQIALPVALLGGAMFLRNHLDRRAKA